MLREVECVLSPVQVCAKGKVEVLRGVEVCAKGGGSVCLREVGSVCYRKCVLKVEVCAKGPK